MALARAWAVKHGLWLDVRSKAQRGDHLAQGAPPLPATKAGSMTLVADRGVAAALAQGLHHTLEQILANAAVLAAGEDARPDHVHQCRVGLRRFRTLVAVFGDGLGDAQPAGQALGDTAADLFRRLGGARDRDVLTALLARPVGDAGYRLSALSGTGADTDDTADAVGDVARGPVFTSFALDALALFVRLQATDAAPQPAPVGVTAGGDAAPARPADVRSWATRSLKREAKRLRRGAVAFEQLDVDEQHRVRKRAKRLRYALEFCASLYPAKRVERYARRLAAAQDALGAYTDVLMGEDALRRQPDHDPGIAFARGWLAGRREATLAACRAPLRAWMKAEAPWG
jgi:CHAD domain-containing protein